MIKLNEVTWYSRLGALILFLFVLPVLTFCIGVQYQMTRDVLMGNYSAHETILAKHTTTTSSTAQGDIPYAMQTINGFSVPQITSFKDAVIMNKVNKQLADKANNFGCDKSDPSPNNSFNAVTKVSYNKNDIFSVSIHADYYCGGAYPTNDSNESMTFDMTTGNQVAFKDLFTDYKRDAKAILSTVFADRIKETSGAPSDQSCNGTYSLEGDSSLSEVMAYPEEISYVVEGDGISSQPEFPHVIAVCSEESHVSAEKLKQFVSSSSILSRIK